MRLTIVTMLIGFTRKNKALSVPTDVTPATLRCPICETRLSDVSQFAVSYFCQGCGSVVNRQGDDSYVCIPPGSQGKGFACKAVTPPVVRIGGQGRIVPQTGKLIITPGTWIG